MPDDLIEALRERRKAHPTARLIFTNGRGGPEGQNQSIALIGRTAGQVASIGTFGERSPGVPELQTGPVAALKQLAPTAKITFAVDDDMTGTPIGAELLSHDGKPGLLRSSANGANSVDAVLDFATKKGSALSPNSVVTWKGDIQIPADGSYWFYLQLLGTRGKLSIDGKEIGRSGAVEGTVHGDVQHATQDNGIPTTDGLDNIRRVYPVVSADHQPWGRPVKLAPNIWGFA
jgi:beta-glucosidase